MKEIDPLARLQAFVAKHPTQGAAADALEISGAYLSDLLKGRREPSPAILERLLREELIPVVATVDEALARGATVVLIGTAAPGGRIADAYRPHLRHALEPASVSSRSRRTPPGTTK